MDTTTGMSPPPIAATRCRPRSNAIADIASSAQRFGSTRNHTNRTALSTNAARLSACRPGRASGDDFIRADSLR